MGSPSFLFVCLFLLRFILDILDDDCANRPLPPSKPGLLEESLASSNEENVGSVTNPPLYKP